ncbi:MAG TPA: DUF3368 domain-containing protein [Thermoanaerobaculia bacterium]|jgi:hypothetical protein|nr:DUF3368 domain-containing protein [Thermoanaerobaculia bacterium]
MSRPPIAVADASPLIAFDQIGKLDLLPQLFSKVVIPPAVAEEAFTGRTVPPWLRVIGPGSPLVIAASLGRGEQQAIALALKHAGAWIVLDDLAARRLAAREGLRVIGTVGLLLAAKSRGLIGATRPLLDILDARGFRLSAAIRSTALQAAGEIEPD